MAVVRNACLPSPTHPCSPTCLPSPGEGDTINTKKVMICADADADTVSYPSVNFYNVFGPILTLTHYYPILPQA